MIQLWSLGVLINLFLFYSIFDIHFKSPIVPVTRRHRLDNAEPPFKRAVIFGADGLRAETFYENSGYRPHLTRVMSKSSSVWGISDTRVPTESRPGHVALFAGFYEDPSAIFTGWQENTVEFDTVFNQSSKSVGLGSPDIVPIFAKGLSPQDKMYFNSYPREWQDFMGDNLTMLDSWVFDQFMELVQHKKLPEDDGVIIFLHFLAIDTIGHSAKPESEDYKRGLEYVDNLIEKAEKLIESYYGDKDTLFIFTSDHGMTNWGSHGSGSVHETETPFVIWQNKEIITTSEPLRLRQADFTALISGSLGIGFPSNSIGRFPSQFWSSSQAPFAYQALLANLHQIKDLMETKKQLISQNRNFPLVSFPSEDEILLKIKKAQKLSSAADYISAIRTLNQGITLALEGMLYYERYDEQLLVIFTVTTTILWIVSVGLIIILLSRNGSSSISGLSSHPNSSSNFIKRLKIFSARNSLIALAASLFITKVLIGWTLWKVPYSFFPIYLLLLLPKLVNFSGGSWLFGSLLILLAFSGLGVELLVTGFEQRSILSLGLMGNAIWCIKAQNKKWNKEDSASSSGGGGSSCSWTTRLIFFCAVAALATFPMMPVIGKKRHPLFITLGPLLSTLLVSILLWLRGRSPSPTSSRDRLILIFQMGLLLSISVLVHFPSLLLTRVVAWMSLLQSYILPVLISSEGVSLRLISIFLAIAAPFSFISFSYEALFFPSLFLVLLIILKIEMSGENLEDSWTEFLNLSRESRERRKIWEKVDLHQAVRRAWFHLFFVTLSFFGTGNIASINSFDPSSTRCFVSIFSPWTMMLVLIEKILGPFLLVSCFFRRLLWNPAQVSRNFLIVLLLCQGMALHTFFQVRREGSWLEIGMSISHHVIVSGTTLFLFILHFLANFLMSWDGFWRGDRQRQNRFSIPSSTSSTTSIMGGAMGRRGSLKKAF